MPPRTRATQAPQKISPVGLRHQRTPISGSDHKSKIERSPNLIMRGSLSDPLGQKKFGTRVSCLETQLLQAQKELKNLKQQLSSAETKKEDQNDLQKKTKKFTSTNSNVKHQENHKEMDVFEVPMQESNESKPESAIEMDHPLNEMDSKKIGIEKLKAELETKEKENEILKKHLDEGNAEISKAHVKEEETLLKCTQLEKDLEASKAIIFELKEKTEILVAEKEELEVEMKKLRIQTEQWRKAADAAASVLAGSADADVVRISGRRGSMDKHFNGVFDPSFMGSEATDELDDGYGVKVKGSVGIRMFGDLWKKKGQK